MKKLQEFAALPGMELVGEPVEMKQGFNPEAARACRAVGETMAKRILEN